MTWERISCPWRTTTPMITGEVSLTDTLDTLEAIGMPYVGAGRNLDEAVKPVSFIANGRKITFVSATQIERTLPPDTKGATETTPGVFRCLEINKLLEVISAAKADSDFDIGIHPLGDGRN